MVDYARNNTLLNPGELCTERPCYECGSVCECPIRYDALRCMYYWDCPNIASITQLTPENRELPKVGELRSLSNTDFTFRIVCPSGSSFTTLVNEDETCCVERVCPNCGCIDPYTQEPVTLAEKLQFSFDIAGVTTFDPGCTFPPDDPCGLFNGLWVSTPRIATDFCGETFFELFYPYSNNVGCQNLFDTRTYRLGFSVGDGSLSVNFNFNETYPNDNLYHAMTALFEWPNYKNWPRYYDPACQTFGSINCWDCSEIPQSGSLTLIGQACCSSDRACIPDPGNIGNCPGQQPFWFRGCDFRNVTISGSLLWV